MLADFTWAVRWLRRSPLFALTITSILALGIGANTAIFSIVDAVLLRPLPYTAAGRLVRIRATSAKNPTIGVSAQEFFAMRARTDLFERAIPYIRDIVTITGAGDPDQVVALRTPPELFDLLGVRAKLGRALTESDQGIAVIGDRLWHRRFHGDTTVIGRAITLGDEAFTIAGVMPPEFDFPESTIEMWVPLRVSPSATRVNVVARLKRGLTAPQAQSAMESVARDMRQSDPQKNAGLKLVVEPWSDTVGREYELTLLFVLAAVGLVLLIACVDASSLLLSRAVQRQKEMAIRASLGAGFWRVARQLLVEAATLAVAGCVAGVWAANYVLRFLTAHIAALPIVLPHLQRVSLNARVFAFTGAVLAVITFLCAIAPVLMARRSDFQSVLRTGQGSSGGGSRIFSVLIAAEAAFAFLLVVASGLMVRSLIRLQEADHGFHSDHVLTMRVPLGSFTQPRPAGKDTRPLQIAYYHRLMQRLEQIPNVRAIAFVNNLPLSGANTSTTFKGGDGETILTSTRTISPQYFAAMAIPVLAGRTFTEADRTDTPPVAIVNQFLARQLFPDRDAIGQTLPGDGTTRATIVGIVKDAAQASYDQPAKGEIYMPYTQYIFGVFLSTIVVRTEGDPLAAAGMLQKEIWAFDPNQPITKIETMEDVVADSIWRPRFSAWLFSALSALALVLTAAGIYGVIAYTTTLRLRELGIRIALGATPSNVVALILRSAFVPLCIGLIGGAAAAMIASRALAGILYEIRGTDPESYLFAGTVLLAMGAAAAIRPAWKAVKSDPLAALRSE